MNRTQEIARAILEQLSRWDDPADEAVLHASIEPRVIPAPMVSEFRDALTFCEQEGWITGVRNKLRGPRWTLTDKGRAQRHS
jgi:hypothetical protein